MSEQNIMKSKESSSIQASTTATLTPTSSPNKSKKRPPCTGITTRGLSRRTTAIILILIALLGSNLIIPWITLNKNETYRTQYEIYSDEFLPTAVHNKGRQASMVQDVTANKTTIPSEVDVAANKTMTSSSHYVVILPISMKPPDGVYPWQSYPPQPIALFDTNNPRVQQRHTCIRKVREVATKALQKTSPSDNVHAEPFLLVDPAFHANVGDNMIYYGQVAFLAAYRGITTNANASAQISHVPPNISNWWELYNPVEGVEICGVFQAAAFITKCSNHVQLTVPQRRKIRHEMQQKQSQDQNQQQQQSPQLSQAFWHGGGNWGDLYPFTHRPRRSSFQYLLKANYSVTHMPESLYFKDARKKKHDAASMRENIALGLGYSKMAPIQDWQDEARRRVTLSWREVYSFEEAQKIYPFVSHQLVPDIAFFLGPYAPQTSQHKIDLQLDILLFLRKDGETLVPQAQRTPEGLAKLLPPRTDGLGQGWRMGVADWNTRLSLWPAKDYLFTDSAIQLLSLGRVVIVDRLHAAILCYLSGIPFVYMDQLTGKITKTFVGVAMQLAGPDCQDGSKSMWAAASSLPEALELAVGFLGKYNL